VERREGASGGVGGEEREARKGKGDARSHKIECKNKGRPKKSSGRLTARLGKKRQIVQTDGRGGLKAHIEPL